MAKRNSRSFRISYDFRMFTHFLLQDILPPLPGDVVGRFQADRKPQSRSSNEKHKFHKTHLNKLRVKLQNFEQVTGKVQTGMEGAGDD